MDYTLRAATPDDYDFLYQLHAATIRAAVEATWGWDEAFQQRYFAERFDPAAQRIIVAGGQDVGVLRLEERNGDLFIALIEIAPDYQGQGLGTRVIEDVLAQAKQKQQPVSLHVLQTNPQARRLYERLGFQIVETREERYVMRYQS